MMKRFLAVLGWVALAVPSGNAADHVDAPGAVADPAADITDIFAWMSPEATELNLILAVPAAAFSDAVQYVFHVESSASYGTAGTEQNVICQFEASQEVECWVGTKDYLRGDASATAGLASRTGRTRAFVGARNDPFFFNSTGFRNTLSAVSAALPSLTLDAAGCPLLDSATSTALIDELNTGGDAFALGTVQALVLQIDKPLIAADGDIVAVWGSTHRR
jgi:hypothetical protein